MTPVCVRRRLGWLMAAIGCGFAAELAALPYLALSGPHTSHTFVLQIENRFQGSARTLLIDVSSLF